MTFNPLRNLAILFLSLQAVAALATDKSIDELRSLIESLRMNQVQVKVVGSLVILDGEVEIPSQREKLEKIARGLRESNPKMAVENLVEVCPATWKKVAERVEREIGSPEITVRFINRHLYVEGTAESDFEADRAVQLAKSYLAIGGAPPVAMKNAPEDRSTASASEGDFVIVDLLRIRPVTPHKPFKKSKR